MPIQNVSISYKKTCTTMKQLFITDVEQPLLFMLNNVQVKASHEAVSHHAVVDPPEQPETPSNAQLLEIFLSAKSVESCSDITRSSSPSCCRPSISVSSISPRMICARSWRTINKLAGAAAATSTIFTAFFWVLLPGWRMRIIFSKAQSDEFTKSAPTNSSRKPIPTRPGKRCEIAVLICAIRA